MLVSRLNRCQIPGGPATYGICGCQSHVDVNMSPHVTLFDDIASISTRDYPSLGDNILRQIDARIDFPSPMLPLGI